MLAADEFVAYYVPMEQLGAGGVFTQPNPAVTPLMLTSQLTGCTFAFDNTGGTLMAGHIQPSPQLDNKTNRMAMGVMATHAPGRDRHDCAEDGRGIYPRSHGRRHLPAQHLEGLYAASRLYPGERGHWLRGDQRDHQTLKLEGALQGDGTFSAVKTYPGAGPVSISVRAAGIAANTTPSIFSRRLRLTPGGAPRIRDWPN